MNLFEKGESIKTELETAEFLNKFFSNIVNNLKISRYSKYESFIDNIEDQTLRAILKYKNHQSIIAIQNKLKSKDVFYFRGVFISQYTDIPSKIFHSCLKTGDIRHIYKKRKRYLKDNYKPVSILPVLSKLYGKSMFKQIY